LIFLKYSKEKGKYMNKLRTENNFSLTTITHLIKFVLVILFLFSNLVTADAQSITKSAGKNTAKYRGILSGKFSGESKHGATSGTFSITISAKGTISGTISVKGRTDTITGTVSDSGEISAKGSTFLSDWSGKLSIVDGRLSGSGTWTIGLATGTWNSN
jgi:hypothetical protein